MRFLFNTYITILFGALLCLSACVLNSDSPAEEEICLSLPCWPPEDAFSSSYPALSRWKICIAGAEEDRSFYTSEKSLSLSVKKNRPVCLSAQPITLLADGSETTFFKPAGFLYPFDFNRSQAENHITWEEGLLADLMKTIFCEGLAESFSPADIEYLVSTFNWKKARESIDKKISESEKVFYNPWLLSKANLLEGISGLSFKTSMLNLSGAIGLNTSVLPSTSTCFLSTFIPENQFLSQKNQFTLVKNSPLLIGDGQKYGIFITYKTSKNISLEFIYLPIYIEDI